jgi:tetratricopeptide (TPR) repeat protein
MLLVGAVLSCALPAQAAKDALEYFEKGIQLMDHERPREALPVFDQGIKANPKLAILYVARAHARIMCEDDKGAIADCSEAIKLDPHLTGAYSRRGYSLCRMRQFEKAMVDFDYALAHKRLDFDRWNDNLDILNRAKASYRLGKRAQSAREQEVVMALGKVTTADDKRTELDVHAAASIMDEVIKVVPDSLGIRYFHGICCMNDSQFDKALQDFNFLTKHDPESPIGYYFRADVLSKTGKLQQAIDDYTKLIQMNPPYVVVCDNAETGRLKGESISYDQTLVRVADIYILRGGIYLRQKKLALAESDLKKGIALAPQDAEAHLALAGLFIDTRRYSEAIAECDKALGINPKSCDAYEFRATANERAGRIDKAVGDVSKWIGLTKDLDAYIKRGNLYAKANEQNKAIDDFTRVLEKGSKTEDDVYICRGDSYFKLGQFDKAIKDYTRALEIDPAGNSGLYRVRAQAYDKIGRADLAALDRKRAGKDAQIKGGDRAK